MAGVTGITGLVVARACVTGVVAASALAVELLDLLEAGIEVGNEDVCLAEPSFAIAAGGATVLADVAFITGAAAAAVAVKRAVCGTAATTTRLPESSLVWTAGAG